MIIIPIGVDCGIATLLKKKNIRQYSLPFDWVVTYNGVSEILKNNFVSYLPKNNHDKISDNTLFLHNVFPKDTEMMNRRIDRLLDLLSNTKNEEEIVFVRKGHGFRHHKETQNLGLTIKDDVIDMVQLHDFIKTTYPHLNFKINLILLCGQCFDHTTIYRDESRQNINIINVSTFLEKEENQNFQTSFNHFFPSL